LITVMDNSNRIPWTTSDILEATGGVLQTGPGDYVFSGISIDSRTIGHGDFFVAIIGDAHDGHNFIAGVLKKGVRGILVGKENTGTSTFEELASGGHVVISVADTTRALGDLASYNRCRTPLSVIALTGSNGKTSTRSMLTCVTANRYETLATAGNFNNAIGLPLTLLRLEEKHELAVLELGMNRPGEIRRLAEICRPDIGMIINVAPAHLEGLGSIEGIKRAKGELLEKLNPGGRAILNADDPNVHALAEDAPGEVLLFGISDDAAIRASRIREQGNGLSFLLETPGETAEVMLDTPGRFMISNALAAAAAGYLLGIPLPEIKAGLERFKSVSGRMHIRELSNGTRIIDDTYNANPESVKAALNTLQQIEKQGRGAAVLGDMLELGEQSAALHREVGRHAALTGPDRLYLTGDSALDMVQGARNGCMDTKRVISGSTQKIAEDLIAWAGPQDWILVKGSRGMHMERIVQELVNTFGQR